MIPLAALVGVMFMVVIGTFEWSTFKMLRRIPKNDVLAIVAVLLSPCGPTLRVLTPIKNTTALLREIPESESDLTRRLNVESRDEISELSNYFNLFISKLQTIVGQVQLQSNRVSETAVRVHAVVSSIDKNTV